MKIYTKNLKVDRSKRQLQRMARDIAESGAAAVCLQEANNNNQRIFDMLKRPYHYQHWRNFKGIGTVAVLSRFPLADGVNKFVSAASSSVTIKINVDTQNVWIRSVHLETPVQSLRNHREQAHQLKEEIKSLRLPTIVAGDFNSEPGGYADIRMRDAGFHRVGPARTTWGCCFWRRDFDRAYYSHGGGKNERRPKLGSDHNGILAEI